MHNELLHIGPLTVYGYGFMIAIGVLAAWFVAEQRARRLKLAYEHIFYLVVRLEDLLLQKFCSGSQTGRNLSRIHDRLSAQMDLWFTEESSEEFLQDGCIAGLRS